MRHRAPVIRQFTIRNSISSLIFSGFSSWSGRTGQTRRRPARRGGCACARSRRGERVDARRPPRRVRAGSGGGVAFAEELLGRPLDRDLAADQLLDRVEREDVVVARERDGGSFRAGAARPADPVHVVLGILGQVVVDDVGDALDVEAARSDVRGDEDGEPPVLEVLQDLQAPLLRDVAGERPRRVAVGRESANELGRRRAAVDEDQDAASPLLVRGARAGAGTSRWTRRGRAPR